jgi:tRNA(Ile)-lysidine synthase
MATAAARLVIDRVVHSLARLGTLRGKRILLALSGGADSVALLHALIAARAKLHFEVVAAHLNHGLRGSESDRDEAFVRELCEQIGVELIVDRARGLEHRTGNLEARAREVRHAFLAREAARTGADYIALAHHADDQAETVLLRMLRGAGVTGLGAMAEAGPGAVIRPLLSVRRSAIRDYLAHIAAAFVDDSTNASLAHERNRVRHHLIPLLERDYAPGLTEHLGELSAEMRQVDDLLDGLAERALRKCRDHDGVLDVVSFKALHAAVAAAAMRRYVAAIVGGLAGFERSHILALCALAGEGPPNGRIALPGGWFARRRYGKLLLVNGEKHNNVAPTFDVPLALEGDTLIEAAGTIFRSRLVPRELVRMPHDTSQALFDSCRLKAGLSVRNFRPGDRIAPLGLGGTRKVKDVFIEHKLPTEQRRRFPVVLLDDRVAWLPGLVRSSLALVTRETKQVVHLSATSGHCVEFKPRATV